MKIFKWLLIFQLLATMNLGAFDIVVNQQMYQKSGLFIFPLLPMEGENFSIGIRAQVQDGKLPKEVMAQLTITDKNKNIICRKNIALKRTRDSLVAKISTQIAHNGIYRLTMVIDPQNKIDEVNKDNNRVELVVPILKSGRNVNFVWFKNPVFCRWPTLITSVGNKTTGELYERLKERGIIPLKWSYGGMNYIRTFKNKPRQPTAEECFSFFLKSYSINNPAIKCGAMGFGCDEFGGYPETSYEKFSIISLKAMLKMRKKYPDLIFAAWHGGGVRNPLVGLYRRAVDFLLLETYVFRAMPWDLSTENIYAQIDARLEPYIRGMDMITPAYKSPCTTLISLDLCERPDLIYTAELENVIRYIRRICPEMRGISFYNGGYGNYGYKRSPTHQQVRDRIFHFADMLCYKYYINSCITLMPNCLWINPKKHKITVAISNIGGIDAGPVNLELAIDGKIVSTGIANNVPAGADRTKNRAIVTFSLAKYKLAGTHSFTVRISNAGESTVLDAEISASCYFRTSKLL